MKALLTKDAEGNDIQLEIPNYIKFITEELKVQDVKSESQGVIEAKNAVAYVVDSAIKDKPLDPEVENELAEVYSRVKADIEATKKHVESEKDRAEREKAEKKEAAELAKKEAAEKEAALKVTRGQFTEAVGAGYSKAVDRFRDDVKQLETDLPEGIHIVKTDAGYGASLDEGATKETVGEALGFMMGRVDSSEFMKRQLSFLAGDLTNAAVKQGIYPDMKSAAKGISEDLAKLNITVSASSIEVYTRLATRTPAALRNPEADPSAYLELSRIKKVKKQDKEEKEAFEARQAKLEEGIADIQTKLSSGEIKNRKEVLPLIQELEYTVGIKERPDPNAKKPTSLTTYLKYFFLATIGIEKLDGVGDKGEPGYVRYLDEDGKTIHKVAVGDLERLRLDAEANLLNAFLEDKKIAVKDFLRGYVIEEQDTVIGTKPDGTAITEKASVKTNVYTPLFFEIEKEEAETEDAQNPENAECAANAAAPQATTEDKVVEAPKAEKPAAKKAARTAK